LRRIGHQNLLCFISSPQSNGQAERANAEILKGLKMRTYVSLKEYGKKWIDHLEPVLWANRTTPNRATGETPFFLVYGAEAVLPPELTNQSPRVRAYDEDMQEELRQQDVVLVEEARRRSTLRAARYQQQLRRYHQRHVRPRSLEVGDYVLKQILTRLGQNKLSPAWEGPFQVIEVYRPGCVRLAATNGEELPFPWNIEHLRKFYP
jgi:hypothetical protein